MITTLIAYIPVIHQGYLRLISETRVQEVFILGPDLIAEFPHLAKEIRAVDPTTIQKILSTLYPKLSIKVLTKTELNQLLTEERSYVLPNEDVMRQFAEMYLSSQSVTFIHLFLRWDKDRTLQQQPVKPYLVLDKNKFEHQMMQLAYDQAQLSSDWWRQIGGVISKDGQVLLAGYNRHLPTERAPYFNGDPRNNFKKGLYIELSTSIHAEASLIAEAAKHGIALEGTELFVTTFPCPNCAKLIACSGIKKLYYVEGYSMVDGEELLKTSGVEIIQIV